MNPNYFPNDFIHGLLAAHCADETGIQAGQSKIKDGDPIRFAPENELYKTFKNEKGLDLNKFVTSWVAHKVIDKADTGYLGIVYVNTEANQAVLAHRSTNFGLGLTTTNLVGQSGVQTDVESVVMGNIILHQAHAYQATEEAMIIAKVKGYALSVTGHSLGAWLAELSVYYCNTVLDCKLVKGVTFDGPGSYEMMKQMSASEVRGAGTMFDEHSLYIVSYFSAPNIVNSANKHVGAQVYRLFPDIKNYNGLLNYFVGKDKHDSLISTLGHDLRYILPQFNPESGKPEKYEHIVKWPSITHKEYGHSPESLFSRFANKIVSELQVTGVKVVDSVLTKVGIEVGDSVLSRIFGYEATSLSSLAYLAIDLASGKISQYQFWEAHKHLNKTDGYDVISNINSLETFDLLYKGQYHCDPVDDYYFMIRGGLDKYFKIIKESVRKVELDSQIGINGDFIQKLQSFAKAYEYNQFADSIMVIDKHKVANTISHLRDEIREFIHHHESAMSHIAILKPDDRPMIGEISLTHKLEDVEDLADSLSPNYILYESNNSKYITKAKKLCDDTGLSSYILSSMVQPQDLLNYVWLEYSIANSYMADHKGKQARDILLKLINNLKQYVLNQNPHLKAEAMGDNFKLIQELKNDGMKVMLVKAVYSLGRTFFYIKDNMQEAKSYLESVARLAQVKIEGNKDLQDLFEVHLSKANALGIIIREEAEKYLLLGDVAKAMQKLGEAIQLYKKIIKDKTVYKLDYDHNMQYDREIMPYKDAYALAECYEQIAKCYLDQSKINNHYVHEALSSIIGMQNTEFGFNIKLEKIGSKKGASALNTLSDILLTGSSTLNYEQTKQQVLQWLNLGALKQELQDGLKGSISVLTLAKAIAHIAKDKSRSVDHTKADAYKMIIEIVDKQIKATGSSLSVEQLDMLKQELQSNKQEMDAINKALGREHSNILQQINIDSRCQNIESIIENHYLENDIIKTKAEYAGEELELSSMLDGQILCFETIFKSETSKQIPAIYLGHTLINAATNGYVIYIATIVNNKEVYNKIEHSDKMTAMSLAASKLAPCVQYCYSEDNCHYIPPVSGSYSYIQNWLSWITDKCKTITTPIESTVYSEQSSNYSEAAAFLANDLFQPMHDEL